MCALRLAATPATAADTCIYDWAVPGPYEISGNFRGQEETVAARLTDDCRIILQLPGVATGGELQPAGDCLAFSIQVEGEHQSFTARWCDDYGVVPWQGRNVQATVVKRQSRSESRVIDAR